MGDEIKNNQTKYHKTQWYRKGDLSKKKKTHNKEIKGRLELFFKEKKKRDRYY